MKNFWNINPTSIRKYFSSYSFRLGCLSIVLLTFFGFWQISQSYLTTLKEYQKRQTFVSLHAKDDSSKETMVTIKNSMQDGYKNYENAMKDSLHASPDSLALLTIAREDFVSAVVINENFPSIFVLSKHNVTLSSVLLRSIDGITKVKNGIYSHDFERTAQGVAIMKKSEKDFALFFHEKL